MVDRRLSVVLISLIAMYTSTYLPSHPPIPLRFCESLPEPPTRLHPMIVCEYTSDNEATPMKESRVGVVVPYLDSADRQSVKR
jgi:hypothetical protein